MDGHGVAVFIVYAVAVLLVGSLLHYVVERPFLRWRERFWKPTSDALPASTAPASPVMATDVP
jgi:peptidoglycan/LPS O-acetylase OafA/YrhL